MDLVKLFTDVFAVILKFVDMQTIVSFVLAFIGVKGVATVADMAIKPMLPKIKVGLSRLKVQLLKLVRHIDDEYIDKIEQVAPETVNAGEKGVADTLREIADILEDKK